MYQYIVHLDKSVLQLHGLIQPLTHFFIMSATSRTSKSVTNTISQPCLSPSQNI